VYTTPTGNKDTDYYPESFYDCYFDWKAEWKTAGSTPGATPTGWSSTAQPDFESLIPAENDFAFVKYLEQNQKCTGVCSTGLFRVGTSPILG